MIREYKKPGLKRLPNLWYSTPSKYALFEKQIANLLKALHRHNFNLHIRYVRGVVNHE